ncbi:H-NS histone family protein [Duganella sp. CY15W]|uniref:H-NS histone family protein n=1 Tax=Duganella sp. CY15W TaxID=2692172 RepID=UPI00136836A1|nr:H-NS histone family protein [Duganella sp. CY15W]MYM29290.1 H-NS histone family protein [Duganella sp. CY15W]
MTTSYAELKAQIAELEKQASQAREAEIANAKNQIREIMQAYSLTIADLAGPAKVSKPRKAVPAKYRDTSTGEEWTGRGRAPKWLDGKNRADYLIK